MRNKKDKVVMHMVFGVESCFLLLAKCRNEREGGAVDNETRPAAKTRERHFSRDNFFDWYACARRLLRLQHGMPKMKRKVEVSCDSVYYLKGE